ncbi:PDR/VanB family oxidoreductase [Xylophilus sp.]|uniref:PDR/VanB family oxidoreductase n=1 Tax=Xylophilus sp. TaxID=2653893 RepID=UPI0013B5D3AB|nr:PDR/VanB family oxidoreductase [Xylophilus sp.]KAF1043040.1 MAG: Phenoxybenzoate dioxygenase subunit beta [Xylophilus sp.]
MSDTLDVAVARRQEEAVGICSFDLADPRGRALPPFAAGAHIDVHLGDGLCRQYSLCNPPGETHRYQIAVLREPQSRGGSAAMHERVRTGTRLTVGRPRNLFALRPGTHPTLLLAGGIGITPLLAMAEQLSRDQAVFTLHYHGRQRGRMAFLDRIGASAFARQVHIHVDDEPATHADPAAALAAHGPAAHVYICGPAGFIDAMTSHAARAGFDAEHVHVEHFAAAPIDHAADGAFELVLARSGLTVMVGRSESAVEALARHGIAVETSCEQGICGTCMTTVLEGEPDHRDRVLSPSERQSGKVFLPCCSRARSPRLVIDL